MGTLCSGWQSRFSLSLCCPNKSCLWLSKRRKKNTFNYARTQFEKQCESALKQKLFNSTENASGLKEENGKLWTGAIITPRGKTQKKWWNLTNKNEEPWKLNRKFVAIIWIKSQAAITFTWMPCLLMHTITKCCIRRSQRKRFTFGWNVGMGVQMEEEESAEEWGWWCHEWKSKRERSVMSETGCRKSIDECIHLKWKNISFQSALNWCFSILELMLFDNRSPSLSLSIEIVFFSENRA